MCMKEYRCCLKFRRGDNHLQIVYYKCVKFHKNPISRLGGDALTRYMDGRTDQMMEFSSKCLTNLMLK
jgi:hypothetical protein